MCLISLTTQMTAGFPRGVIPRGDAFVAKFTSASGCDYLGSFPSAREAKIAYNEAKENARTQGRDEVSSTVKPPPPCNTLLKYVDKWLVEDPPSISERRMCMSHSETMVHEVFETTVIDTDSQPMTEQESQQTVTNIPAGPELIVDEMASVSDVNSFVSIPAANKLKRKPTKEKLYNKLVLVNDQPPCYPYK